MNITKVNVRKANSKNNELKAIASIVIDNELAINDIKLYESNGVYSIEFPNTEKAASLGKYNIAPLSYEVRSKIEQLIIEQWVVKKIMYNWS